MVAVIPAGSVLPGCATSKNILQPPATTIITSNMWSKFVRRTTFAVRRGSGVTWGDLKGLDRGYRSRIDSYQRRSVYLEILKFDLL
jgi:hypothetical protein